MKKSLPKLKRVMLLLEASEFSRGLSKGIYRYSRVHGPWMMYMEYRGIESKLPSFDKWEIDGIVLRETKHFEKVIRLNKPTLFCGVTRESLPGIPTIKTNGVEIGQMAAKHFIDRGFVNFAYCGYSDMPWSMERGKAFVEVISKAGFKADVYSSLYSRIKESWEIEEEQVADWLLSLPKPVGVLACNDFRGKNIAEACRMAGLHIPEEVAVLGVDNAEMVCDACYPPLSSIKLNCDVAGYQAAELLDKLMSGEQAKEQTIYVNPTGVQVRQSTDILAIDDSEVAKAVAFIRQHNREIISVDDVVESTTISRRVLQNRFSMVLGRSIHDEILRVRLEEIKNMLIETDITLSQIAYAFGYPDHKHLSRFFKKATGQSTRQYRNERKPKQQ